MKTTVHRELKINMGNYEHVVIGASVEWETSGPQQLTRLDATRAQEALDMLLADEVDLYRSLTVHKDSFVHELHLSDPGSPTPPKRSTVPPRRN